MSGIKKLQFDHVQILCILELGVKNVSKKFLLTQTKLHQKSTSLSGAIKSFRPGRRMYMYTEVPLNNLKIVLKAFDDLKNKQKSVWSNVFWYVNVCIQWTHPNSTPPNSNISLIRTNPLSPWKSLNKLS